ncbi:3,4-dihydroxy-2-butanone-4-phosphate synthase [Enhydrobacter sp.]|jgi:3,4-dihydroxy 2-butanone 4-phosphate synthase/GTP cyclohydrolase II|uniref:3,4-dihydroxy-2-butanone-4-phosphate synthase n=1 Tax=Enhydrobacter sp. TaxID=1894999 RepID=UPI002622DFAA|nr:3,4-dihydroxy-2-butanone-4-phosphate synthase [Enhydrobacter sp.]WIM13674.1 MAG: 3,4-dihydroxy-2-butanone 4-phosphate synthase / GTP cyclohydrolase II [Enhydrobacter sp.]
MNALDKDAWRITFGEVKAAAEDIIEEARKGRMFILVDDEDRENEGDLVIPAQFATPEAINFMAKHARGLICLALPRERVEQLGLSLMSQNNGTRHQTAFTTSIEAREGVTTGISAADRARTVAVAIDPSCGPQDIVTPGHVFPLVARDGGTLERTGHTEAAVDLARLAGLTPAGVICEIMNDDGTMARRNDLISFAQRHGLKIGTIADLIAYRRRYDSIVKRISDTMFDSIYGGDFRCVVYLNKVTKAQHIALVKGDPATGGPVMVRMHAVNIFTDTLGQRSGGRGGEIEASMKAIAEEGRGVIVLIREPLTVVLSEQRRRAGEPIAPAGGELRDYGVGAQILIDLGVKDMVLLTNSKKSIVGLEGFGLRVVGQRPVPGRAAR